jgi:hypothetical protein
MNIKKSGKTNSNHLIVGFGLLAVGIGAIIGSMYRLGEINCLKEMNRELLRESEKKSYYLGKQFAELIIKKTRA